MSIFNDFFVKENPFLNFVGFGGGVAGLQFFSGAAQSNTITGSGGVVTAGVSPGDGYVYHTFFDPGSFTWTGGSDSSYCEFLIVAGGGGGANARVGGGGGAGQVLQSIQYSVPASNGGSGLTVTVGDGGPKVSGSPGDPGYGGNSIISSPVGIITALGGGWGGYTEGGNNGGMDRGSGGGGRANENVPRYFPSPSYGYPFGYENPYPTVGVGSDLARGANWSTPTATGTLGGGGGGGAWIPGAIGGFNVSGSEVATYPTWIESTAAPYSTPGKGWANPATTATTAKGGCGGDGLRLHTYRASQHIPSPNPYYPFLNAMNGYYGGGGGGGHVSPYPTYSSDLAPGGLGGGACGTNEGNSSTVPGMNGTGGGGGGGGNSTGGSDGGDGICVIRYKADVTTVTGGTKTDHSGSTFHVFTEPGVFEVPATSPRVGQTMKIMAIGGGGGGGSYNGGGGGAGLYYVNSSVTVTAGRMGVVIGQGGRGANDFSSGNVGGSTTPQRGETERGPYAANGHPTFTIGATNVGVPAEIVLLGGGKGGSNSTDHDGGDAIGPQGGSGGGGADNGDPGTAGPSPYSYAGGNSNQPNAGGGGGGAGGGGAPTPGNNNGGPGGAGVGTPWIPNGLPAFYGKPSGSIMYHGGGGGGGARSGGSPGSGGNGGGGDGEIHHPNLSSYAVMRATYATGGGGGGGVGGPESYVGPYSGHYSGTANGRGGEGAPGVMIIQYTSV